MEGERLWRVDLGPNIRSARVCPRSEPPSPCSAPSARPPRQPAWTAPGADLGASAKRRDGTAMGWVDAGIAPPPNLTTELVWRVAEPL
ncbi:hypothetical protein [Streptomyces sp. SA15]|uniref:hypothetical protein n=1 Tax=Streptomyces sp. SA15 TaxID=934019 RepID=UPI00359C6E58